MLGTAPSVSKPKKQKYNVYNISRTMQQQQKERELGNMCRLTACHHPFCHQGAAKRAKEPPSKQQANEPQCCQQAREPPSEQTSCRRASRPVQEIARRDDEPAACTLTGSCHHGTTRGRNLPRWRRHPTADVLLSSSAERVPFPPCSPSSSWCWWQPPQTPLSTLT